MVKKAHFDHSHDWAPLKEARVSMCTSEMFWSYVTYRLLQRDNSAYYFVDLQGVLLKTKSPIQEHSMTMPRERLIIMHNLKSRLLGWWGTCTVNTRLLWDIIDTKLEYDR